MTSIIDTCEERAASAAEVKGTCLKDHFDEFLMVKLEGEQVKIMCDVNNECNKHVTEEFGKSVLHLVLNNSLHGCVQSSLLWHTLFSTTLLEMGFTLNPYDLCVANKIIDGNQCTIVWQLDDRKMSHKSQSVVKSIVENIESKLERCRRLAMG